MRIIIDGDSCSGIDLISEISLNYNIKVYLFCDVNHLINKPNIEVIQVDEGYQNVDMHIANFVENGDIVITNDYGLATLVLSKCKVLTSRGMIFTKENIDFLLENRHFNKMKPVGPKKMTCKDYELLKVNLIKLILNQ